MLTHPAAIPLESFYDVFRFLSTKEGKHHAAKTDRNGTIKTDSTAQK